MGVRRQCFVEAEAQSGEGLLPRARWLRLRVDEKRPSVEETEGERQLPTAGGDAAICWTILLWCAMMGSRCTLTCTQRSNGGAFVRVIDAVVLHWKEKSG